MERIIVQRGSKQKQGAEYCRSDGSLLTIGRAFDNDLLISDPYVAEHQLKLEYEENHWILRVLDHVNPVLLNGVLVSDKIGIQSGDQLTIGHTQLSLFSESHGVEKTRHLLFSAKWYQAGFIRNVSLMAILMTLAITFVSAYNSSLVGLDWSVIGAESFSVVATIFVWAGFFALVGKLVIHQANYFLQVMVTALVFVLDTALDFLPEYVEYQFSHALVGEMTNHVVAIAVLTLLFKLNLYFSTHMMKSTLLATVLSISFVGVGVIVETYDDKEFNSLPVFSEVVKPPFSQLAPAISLEEHFKEVKYSL